MKKLMTPATCLFFTLTILCPLFSMAQFSEWEHKLLRTGKCKVHAVTSDRSGNTILTGSFSGSLAPHSGTYKTYGASDIFTAKYNSAGDLLWLKQAGGSNDEEAYAITCDKTGNIYITGYFSGFLNIDNLGLDASETEKNCFVIKYDKDGDVQWCMRSFGASDKYGKAITTDDDGNVFFTGIFKDEMLFENEDPNELCETRSDHDEEEVVLKSKSSSNIFIAKANSNGEMIWLQQSLGKGIHEATTIETDTENNCYLKGTFSDRCSFGRKKIKSRNGKRFFITKYDASGNVLWAKDQSSAL